MFVFLLLFDGVMVFGSTNPNQKIMLWVDKMNKVQKEFFVLFSLDGTLNLWSRKRVSRRTADDPHHTRANR